jgi:hypothetical protein
LLQQDNKKNTFSIWTSIIFGGEWSYMKAIWCLFLLLTSQSLYAGEPVRVFLNQNKPYVTGNQVLPEDQIYVLFTSKPCHLPIADKRNVFYFVQLPASNSIRRGCWYPTLDNGFVIIYANGELSKQPLWKSFPRGSLNTDGTISITETNYDSATFLKKTLDKNFNELLQKRKAGDY